MSDDTAKKGLALKLFGPAAEAAGSTLKGIWETVFGKIDLYNAKQNVLRAKALDDFKASLEQKVLGFALSQGTPNEIATVEPGIVETTPFGEAFISVCLP